MKKLLLLIGLITLLLLIVTAPTSAQRSSDGAIFQPTLPVLRQKTQVPLRLPTYLAAEGETAQLYAIIEVATARRYELQIAFTPDCGGGTACRHGSVSGQAIGPNTRRMRGKAVKLDQGLTGYFVDFNCGANCSDATLSWQEGSYRYTVAIKAGDVGSLRKMANSAIANAQRVKPDPPDMTQWVGKYPDRKFLNQPVIRNPLRRILSKEDFASLDDYNLVIPIARVGDYLLVRNSTIKYSDPNESLDLAFSLKDNAVYIVFWKGDDNRTHRKFSTKNNQFNLPDEVLKELGLKEE